MIATETLTEAPARVETPRPLKLSEAIRFGGMSTTQIFGAFGDTERTCAIGAANVAFGRRPDDTELIRLLEGRRVDAVPCGHYSDGACVTAAIIHLNDSDKWPRENIADWLQGIGL